MLRTLSKYIIHRTYRPLLQLYLNKERDFSYEGINVKVAKGIFHPGFYFSTKLLIYYLKNLELKEKEILELGCGSGLISIWCAQNGAYVTASDINPEAVKLTLQNAVINKVVVEGIESDLFQQIIKDHFDLIIINPPYYPKEAENDAEKAWYCGSNFEYFEKLFPQLASYIKKGTTAIMILSDDCELEAIFKIADEAGLSLEEAYQKRYLIETNYIYEIKQK